MFLCPITLATLQPRQPVALCPLLSRLRWMSVQNYKSHLLLVGDSSTKLAFLAKLAFWQQNSSWTCLCKFFTFPCINTRPQFSTVCWYWLNSSSNGIQLCQPVTNCLPCCLWHVSPGGFTCVIGAYDHRMRIVSCWFSQGPSCIAGKGVLTSVSSSHEHVELIY